MNRREFMTGMAGILAAGVAPAFVGSNILMPIRQIITPYTGGILNLDVAAIDKRLFKYIRFAAVGGDKFLKIQGSNDNSHWQVIGELNNLIGVTA